MIDGTVVKVASVMFVLLLLLYVWAMGNDDDPTLPHPGVDL